MITFGAPTNSPEWWFGRLFERLQERAPGYTENQNYFRGDPPPALGPANTDSYRRFLQLSKANWADLIVEAVRERMEVLGFKTGAEADSDGDDLAWRIFQANRLDSEMPLLLEEMLALGDGYMIVGPPVDDIPTITVESPFNVIAAEGSRRFDTRAALKLYQDDWTGDHRAVLYLPGAALYASAPAESLHGFPVVTSWKFTGQVDKAPAGLVPVTRFRNRPTAESGAGRSEFEHVKPDLNRINTMLLQRVTVAIMQAFRQRAVQGVPMDGSDKDFDWDNALMADPGALWRLPEGIAMWESGGVDLTPILESVKADVRDVAARTRTPMFYLFPDAANGSAEGASLQREGLVFKTNDRIRQTSESVEQVMSHAFTWLGDTERASRVDMESIWAPPERFTLAERYDAASKASAAGVPWETVMADVLQFSPQQIARMRTERATDTLLLPEVQ